MRILILGASTGLGLQTSRLLADRGDHALGLIRDPAHAEPLRTHGGEPVLFDPDGDPRALMSTVADRLAGVDAVVLAAGTGTGAGSLGRATASRSPAMLLADVARRVGVMRYVLVTTLALDHERPTDPERARYLHAKRDAEDFLRGTDLSWTILRPARLTDAPATGRVTLTADGLPDGEIGRGDVAATICAVLDERATAGLSLQVGPGGEPVGAAVAAVVNG